MPRTWHILLHVAVYCIYHLGLMHVKDICITIHICEAPTKRSSFAYRENHKPRKLTWGHCQPLLNGWESQVQETLKKNRKQILHQFHPTNDLKSYTYTSRAKWNICKPPKKVYLNYPTISCNCPLLGPPHCLEPSFISVTTFILTKLAWTKSVVIGNTSSIPYIQLSLWRHCS